MQCNWFIANCKNNAYCFKWQLTKVVAINVACSRLIALMANNDGEIGHYSALCPCRIFNISVKITRPYYHHAIISNLY